LFDKIIVQEKDDTALTIQQADSTYKDTDENKDIQKPGKTHPLFTTKGWCICILWQDGSTSWHTLADIKNSYPAQLAEYAYQNNIHIEPTFKWWIKQIYMKKERFIKTVKSGYTTRTHTFGMCVPKTIEEALAIDKATDTMYCHNAIQKEMKRLDFKFLDENDSVPIDYKWIKCHLIFKVKNGFHAQGMLSGWGT
jgi:hypothetical protein